MLCVSGNIGLTVTMLSVDLVSTSVDERPVGTVFAVGRCSEVDLTTGRDGTDFTGIAGDTDGTRLLEWSSFADDPGVLDFSIMSDFDARTSRILSNPRRDDEGLPWVPSLTTLLCLGLVVELLSVTETFVAPQPILL